MCPLKQGKGCLLYHKSYCEGFRLWQSPSGAQACAAGLQEFMKAVMCFMVEFWDVDRQPQPPIKPHSEPYVDFEWPLQGWCIDLPQVCRTAALILPSERCMPHKKECAFSAIQGDAYGLGVYCGVAIWKFIDKLHVITQIPLW